MGIEADDLRPEDLEKEARAEGWKAGRLLSWW
jgi:hypothetical protein